MKVELLTVKFFKNWAVVVAQLVEWLLLTPEIRGSNPKIGKVLSTTTKLNRKDENKKEACNSPSLFFKNKKVSFSASADNEQV